ncbi:hypothetical protein [Litorisediminicola beolgyonensis]
MTKTIALIAAALLALAGPAFAKGHNMASENDKRADRGAEALVTGPKGLISDNAKTGFDAATTKSGNADKDDE